MKIGILLLNNDPSYRGGVNSFIHGLLGGLKAEDKVNQYYILVCDKDRRHYQKYLSKNFHIKSFSDQYKVHLGFKYYVLLLLKAPILRNFYYLTERIFYSDLIHKINSLNLDVIYSPLMPFFPLALNGKLVISPHDIQHLHFPQYFSKLEKWDRATIFGPSLKSADVIQASTHFMKKDITKMMGIEPGKIVVIPEGVTNDFLSFKPHEKESKEFLKKFNLAPNYLFYPAQHWPHKNHTTLLKAIVYLKRKHPDIRVVFTGEKRTALKFVYGFVIDNKLTENVKFIGNIRFHELFYAYRNALAVVVPVVYESSSLPVKEAMAMGIPVIASKNGANEEINLNDNILLFNTYDHKELARIIKRLIGDRKARTLLVARSKQVIKNYSWRNVAKQYVQVFTDKARGHS